ncbi:hypothetical protein [Paenibacillus brevis]|uniref:Uncharacterized protein n=1 Tax=Paenibacillus brevis TaxID=2841508 RepID=A0ABS6FWL6_9BACL|nr:hypothetical protein [Paenibacillus brevis]MBU5674618.1 hypothetical protein [Paenibacillus brevis]
MLVIILLLQLVIIAYLISIHGRLPKRDYVKEALERDKKSRQESGDS